MTDQPLPDPHPNRDACRALVGHRVKSRHPKFPERVVEGIVIGYDPRPYQLPDGDWLVVRPDKAENDVWHPPYVTVKFEWLITDSSNQGSPTAEEMNRTRKMGV